MTNFKFFWTTHKWVGIIGAVIFLNIAVTGFLLLMKKKYAWIQPPTVTGTVPGEIAVTFDQIIEAARGENKGIDSWDDVDRLDVRPGKGIVKVRGKNSWEVQVDAATGEVVQVMYRRSDLIEDIHDGSFFAEWIHTYLWPVVSCSLGFLAFSGWWLWLEPKYRKAKRRKMRAKITSTG